VFRFKQFYENVFTEMSNLGEVEEMMVVDNLGEHIVDNVYVKYSSEEYAENAMKNINGRFTMGEKSSLTTRLLQTSVTPNASSILTVAANAEVIATICTLNHVLALSRMISLLKCICYTPNTVSRRNLNSVLDLETGIVAKKRIIANAEETAIIIAMKMTIII
jgi:hypothetical protein